MIEMTNALFGKPVVNTKSYV